MARDATTHEIPTRRDFVKGGGGLVGGALLAGCSGDGSGSTPTATETETETITSTNTTDTNGSYTVTMAPVGEVEFTEPPENIYTARTHHADMALALGYGDGVNAMVSADLFSEIYDKLFEQLDGLSVDWEGLYDSWPTSKEKLYELDSDLHLEDPAYLTMNMDGWDPADIEEVRESISPWFGNSLSNEHVEPSEAYADIYQYYTLWEIFEKVSEVFQKPDRYDALAEMHTEIVSEIQSNLPTEEDRPVVARVQISPSGVNEGIWAYSMNGPGFVRAHTRPAGARDAFPDMQVGTQIDLEALSEANPDVLLRTASFSPGANWKAVKRDLQNDPVAQGIPAIENDRFYPLIYRGGGPILNLFQLEMIAKQLYPEQFGEWPAYDGGAYPDFSKEEQLFDHQRVADIINGEF